MWAIVIVCLAIVVLTFYQMHTQGFFSTVIMAGDTMLAAFVALNYYEKLAALLSEVGLSGFGLGCITLLGLFSITLLILRMITDRLVGGNMNFPTLVDRIGAGVFGLIASMIVVGMVMIGFQQVAVPAEFLGYNRYPNLAKLEDERGLFPGPDRFVLSLLDHASNFGFSGKSTFSQHHPDLLQELYLNRLVPTDHEGSRHEAGYDSLRLVSARLIERVRDLVSGELVDVPAGETFLALRLEVLPGDGKENPGAADADSKIRYALGDFRVVGHEQDVPHGIGYSRYPIGFLKPGGIVVEATTLEVGKILTTSSKQVDLLFHWPSNIKKIPPLYVEFKRTARAELPSSGKLAEAQLAMDRLYDASNTAGQATLRNAAKARTSYQLLNLVVVPYGRQPLEDMGVPVTALLERAEKVSDATIEDGIRHFQIEPTQYSQRDNLGERMNLYVPDGFCLVYLKVRGGSQRQKSNYVAPVLIDVFGRRHRSVGFALTGSVGGEDVREFAYTSFNDQGDELEFDTVFSWRFPSENKTRRQGGSFNRLTQFYLVPQKDVPVGLLGVQLQRGRGDAGEFWTLSGDVDVVLVPAR